MRVTIKGHSDDCIEIEGDLCEEFDHYSGWAYLHFSDGTVVKIGYCMDEHPEKGWHIEVVRLGDGAVATSDFAIYDDEDHYTDVLNLVFPGNVWADCWEYEDGPDADDLAEEIQDLLDEGGNSYEALKEAYTILKKASAK